MRIKNLPSIESMDGSQDALIIEQTDGSEDKSRKVSPAQIKQYVETGNFTATEEITDGHGNVLKDMAKSADVDEEIGDLTQTGLTGDSVAEQLGDASGKLAALLITDTFTTEAKNFTAGTDGYCSIAGVNKNGYTMLGIIDLDANKTGFGLTTWHSNPGGTSGSVTAWIRPLVNITGLTITFKILYIKNLS